MATKFLPNTAITSMVMNGVIYAYAQDYEGNLQEFGGSMKDVGGQSVYINDKKKSAVAVVRSEDEALATNAPKIFTPVAAAPFTPLANGTRNTRYLFYINDKHILCDAYNDGNGWNDGKLASSNILCASYSKLAATTVVNHLYNFICVYYQTPDADGAIKMASLSGGTMQWTNSGPDLRDPPLFGTSLTALPPRPGIYVTKATDDAAKRQPVYYMQMDTLQLGHAQGESDPVIMSGLELDGKALVFSPQTSLTAVDDDSKLYIIYKSNNSAVKMIEIVNHQPSSPERFDQINTTPMSAIAACLSPDKRVVLFYQSLNTTTRQVNLFARTLYKSSTASTGWTESKESKLGS